MRFSGCGFRFNLNHPPLHRANTVIPPGGQCRLRPAVEGPRQPLQIFSSLRSSSVLSVSSVVNSSSSSFTPASPPISSPSRSATAQKIHSPSEYPSQSAPSTPPARQTSFPPAISSRTAPQSSSVKNSPNNRAGASPPSAPFH